MSRKPRVLVMGAINQDEIARVDRHPKPGETVISDGIEFAPGGKGANQAAAAAATGLDVSVQLLGAVGDDAAGEEQLRSLRESNVDTSLVRRVIGTPTGRAHITVSADGENSIVVGLGANAFVSLVNINGAAEPTVVVAQTEIGGAAIDALCDFSLTWGARLIVNNAPVVHLRDKTLASADPLILNELEAGESLERLGLSPHRASATELAEALVDAVGCISAVVTLGAAGCAVVDSNGARVFAAVPVDTVVDTTGAGDCFVGTLAAALAVGHTLDSAVERALHAASAAVTWHGARAPLSSIGT